MRGISKIALGRRRDFGDSDRCGRACWLLAVTERPGRVCTPASLSLSLESCRVMSRQVFYINPTDLNEAAELPLKAGCKGRRVGFARSEKVMDDKKQSAVLCSKSAFPAFRRHWRFRKDRES